jgi:hypothetical protein
MKRVVNSVPAIRLVFQRAVMVNWFVTTADHSVTDFTPIPVNRCFISITKAFCVIPTVGKDVVRARLDGIARVNNGAFYKMWTIRAKSGFKKKQHAHKRNQNKTIATTNEQRADDNDDEQFTGSF